jgi:hypothetical protein
VLFDLRWCRDHERLAGYAGLGSPGATFGSLREAAAMGPIKALIGALIGGAIGAAIWAAIAYNTGYEVGYVAWGIGLLCGLGAMALARSDADAITGIVAAVVAIASVGAGKYLAVHFLVKDLMPAGAIEIAAEDAQMYMANELVENYPSDAKPLKWPEGMDTETAETLDNYPAEVKKDVLDRWNGMSASDQQAYQDSVQDQYEYEISKMTGAIESEGFVATIGLFDILWLVLAVGTAFKVGSGAGSDD